MKELTYYNILVRKGTVSWDWERLQWIPSERSEEYRVPSSLTQFSCFMYKKHALVVSKWQFLCDDELTTADHSLLPVLYMYDRFCKSWVSPQMKKSCMTSPPAKLPPLFQSLYDQSSMFCLLDLSASEQLINGADLRLLLIIPRETLKWETAAAWFFSQGTAWKLILKPKNDFSGKGTHLRSIYKTFYCSFSNAWRYPFNLFNTIFIQ